MLAAASLGGQTFEGTVVAKMPMFGTGDLTYRIKGDKSATTMSMGGMEARLITDQTAGTTTMLIPMAMGNSKGMKMVIDMKKEAAKMNGKPAVIKPLGTSETIAGYKCENIEITSDQSVTVACISRQLGGFSFTGGGIMGRGGNGTPSWASVLGGRPGFPLRVTGSDGKLIFEVTSVHPGSISADVFAIPEGYGDMSNFGGRRGGGL